MSEATSIAAPPDIEKRLKQVVANIRNLPTPPIVFQQIQKVMNDPGASAVKIGSIIAEDPAMSVKVLKLTNSAFYGLSREIESVSQAVLVIGTEAIRNLILAASVLDMFNSKGATQDYQNRFWRHSLATGACSRILARQIRSRGMVDPDSAFSAGLLHDIGKMVIVCFMPREFEMIQEARKEMPNAPDFEVEQQALGFHHAHVGSFLGQQWKLPARLLDAVAWHHHPQLCQSDDCMPQLVHIGNHLAKKTFSNDTDQGQIYPPDSTVMEYMDVNDEQLDQLGDQLREEYLKAETFMSMASVS